MSDISSGLAAALSDRYLLERELGQGGMATVYLAQDLKHDRKVAVKVLRPELAAVIGAERFLAEIKTTAALQHPHILPLHDSGAAGSFLYYVMPFIEGESLRDRLWREKQLPVGDAIRIASEVASALDYAHRHNVIHRDIKPENILLHDGQALVADFGIALAASKAGGARMTETGMSLGTPHYMSPEQAMGEREITARSDVYALGCVLYEMLLGEPPFTGPTAQAIVAKVMTERPAPLISRRERVPAEVEEAVLTALEKLPADRYATAAEFSAAVQGKGPIGTARTVPIVVRRSGLPTIPTAIAITAVAAVAVWGWLRTPSAGGDRVTRFAVSLPASEQLYEAPIPLMAAAPDGSGFVYVGVGPQGRRLYWHSFNRFGSQALPGTEDAERPFISPDGLWIGYRANNKMWKVPLAGGAPKLIIDGGFGSATWTADHRIVFGGMRGLSSVPEDGGPLDTLTRVDTAGSELFHDRPRLLPGGRMVVFEIGTRNGSRLAAVSLSGGAITDLGPGSMPRYVEGGFLAYLTPEGPRVARFDPQAPKLVGTPVPVETEAGINSEPVSELDVSDNGTLVYLTRDPTRRALVEVDRQGRERVLLPELRGYDGPRYARDGRRLAVRIQGEGFQIWVLDLLLGTTLRLTLNRASYYPEWTPDGSRVVYPSTHDNETGLWWKLASGAGEAEPLYDPPQAQWESSWSPDGRMVVVRQNDSVTGRDLWLMRMPERTAAPLLATAASEYSPAVSPDGHFLAYVSTTTGRAEVYVRSLPDSAGTWVVSEGGGTEPGWAPDGRHLYYRNGGAIMEVGVSTRPSFSLGRRDTLLTGSYVPNPTHANYAIHPSGDRFVMVRMAEGERRAVVVLNWAAELAAEGRRP